MKGLNLDYIKILFAIAWSDSELQKEEQDLLSEVIASLDFSDKEKEISQKFRETPLFFEDIESIDYKQFSYDQKMHILLLAGSVVKADGVVTDEEVTFVDKLKKLLGLGDINIDDIISDIEDSIDIFG
jgi:uncharacterized tellurite resistance protein B-like protein